MSQLANTRVNLNEPIITNEIETDGILRFTLSGVDVSIANGLRRTILTDIETLVIRGFPHEKCNINIEKNNTSFHNEYLKHRLTSIPVHVSDTVDFENYIQNYKIMLNKKNTTQQTIIVTTEDFVVVRKDNDKQTLDSSTIFPADINSGDYIPICTLSPVTNNVMEPEEINLTIEFDKGKAKENGCWNTVDLCTYENTKDLELAQEKWQEKKDTMDSDNIELEEMDFKNLDAERLFIPNSYDFQIESNNIYTNNTIIKYASDYIIIVLSSFIDMLTKQEAPKKDYELIAEYNLFEIFEANTSIPNTFYLRIEENDYTIGKMIEKYIYIILGDKISYVSFKKDHPNDSHCFVIFSYKEESDKNGIYDDLSLVSNVCIDIFNKIKERFS
jgi:DNA-directed RNA polymerase II subunit RPB3